MPEFSQVRPPKKRPMGAKTKLTPALIEKITQLVRAGNYIETACQACGISTSTYHIWMQLAEEEVEGRKRKKIHLDFMEAVKAARAEAESRNVAIIAKAAQDGSWQAAGWYLERSYPHKFGQRKMVDKNVNENEGEVDEGRMARRTDRLMELFGEARTRRSGPDSGGSAES